MKSRKNKESTDCLQLGQHFYLRIKIWSSFPHANTSKNFEKEILTRGKKCQAVAHITESIDTMEVQEGKFQI